MKNTVNTMVNQLSSFATEVTRVAREVGVEGNLGGQAEVAGVSGTWLALTRNVNSLAATLTLQLRAIANVAHAVARGDLTQSVDFEAAGEIADLTESINQMITALRDKTRQNTDADWLNSNLARISSLLQGRRGVEEVTRMVLDEVTPLIDAQTSTFYVRHEDVSGHVTYRLNAVYGHPNPGEKKLIEDNEGMVGQAAASKRTIHLHDIPEGYLEISSGLGQATPTDLDHPARPVRRQGARRHRVRLVQHLLRAPQAVPGRARAERGRHARHDRGQRAHRGAAARVAAHGRRSCAPSPTGSRRRTWSWRRRRSCSPRRTRRSS